jgi:hypothetical protein
VERPNAVLGRVRTDIFVGHVLVPYRIAALVTLFRDAVRHRDMNVKELLAESFPQMVDLAFGTNRIDHNEPVFRPIVVGGY